MYYWQDPTWIANIFGGVKAPTSLVVCNEALPAPIQERVAQAARLAFDGEHEQAEFARSLAGYGGLPDEGGCA